MGLVLLTERHANQIAGVLSCYDRVIVQGTLPVFCQADGMTAYWSKVGFESSVSRNSSSPYGCHLSTTPRNWPRPMA